MKPNCTNAEWIGRAKCSVCEVRNIVLFAGLTNDELDRILHPIDNLHAPAGAVLYEQGGSGSSVFTVRSGMVKLTLDIADGGGRIVRLLGAGDVAGLEALLAQPYKHTATVLHDADLCRIPAELVNQLDQTQPKLHRQLLLRWQKAVDQADSLIACLASGKIEARLARLLLKLGCRDESSRGYMLNREDMGALLGVTTETASRAMAEFKRQGWVREEKGYCVFCNRQALAALAHA